MTSSKKKKKFTHLKNAAVILRKQGKTYSEIKKIYNIPKSTLSGWFKNIEIPQKIKVKMQEHSYKKWRAANEIFIRQKIEAALKKRLTWQNKAEKEIKVINESNLKLIGCALYWAEGSTKERNHLRFANSKPEIIKVFLRFCRKICKIKNKNIKARVHTYPGINYRKILNFWSKVTKLEKNNFYKPQTQISRLSKSKRSKDALPYGTLHLIAGNTEIASKVKGWIQGIAEKF